MLTILIFYSVKYINSKKSDIVDTEPQFQENDQVRALNEKARILWENGRVKEAQDVLTMSSYYSTSTINNKDLF